QLITIENVTLVDPASWGSGSFNTDVTNGTDTFAVRIDSDVDISGMAAPLGTFNITGLGGQFDSSSPYSEGYQLLPRYVADIDPYNTTVVSDEYPAYDIGVVTTVDADGAADSLDVKCQLQGVVYGVNMRSSGLQFTLIDNNNDGIGLISFSDDWGYSVNEGDEIIVQGEIGFYNGLTQINPDSVWMVSAGNSLFDPSIVTALGEETESQLITIENVTLVDPASWGSGSFNTDVTNGTDTFAVR
ncbi:MAG: hypothetical protein GY751_24000, partial [Bacteroidetes bacterium]|nr:hypothetical protein [Bacteroidota bacterium]